MPYLFGYHRSEVLPFKKGDSVRIPRGAMVKTMHPSKPNRPARRSYKIKVNHVLPGMDVKVGHVYPDGTFHEAVWHGDLRAIEKAYGTDDVLSLWPLMKTNKYGDVSIPIQNPSVRWPGEGGYWCEADMNEVESAE